MKKILGVIIAGIAVGFISLAVILVGYNILKDNNILPVANQVVETKESNNQQTEETTSKKVEQEKPKVESSYATYSYQNIVDLVDAAMPSVVSVTNIQKYVQNGYSIFGFRTEQREVEVPASGSGVIVGLTDQEVIILTNNHVVSGSTSLSVTFNDGSEAIEAQIKGIDADKDLAVISVLKEKISKDILSNVKAITLADSSNIKVGEQVVAIGNALGIGQSVTTGIISAKDRLIDEINNSQPLIQIDAAINPGNSGGALINMRGELIGINVAKTAGNAIEGMGYAIPINSAKDVVDTMSSKKPRESVPEKEQGYLGIVARNIDNQTAQSFDMPEGIYVFKIDEEGPAKNSELKEKDIIVAFDDQNIKTLSELQELLKYSRGGEQVNIKVKRVEGGSYVDKEFKFTLGTRPAETETTASSDEQASQNQSGNENGGYYGNFNFDDFFGQFNRGFGW